jgi:hypothetical protein
MIAPISAEDYKYFRLYVRIHVRYCMMQNWRHAHNMYVLQNISKTLTFRSVAFPYVSVQYVQYMNISKINQSFFALMFKVFSECDHIHETFAALLSVRMYPIYLPFNTIV